MMDKKVIREHFSTKSQKKKKKKKNQYSIIDTLSKIPQGLLKGS